MQQNTQSRPGAVEFLQMWKHFNEMAHESGVVRKALQNYQQNESAWLNYYLYFNHFEAVGQTLLVYCLRELLDIAATHHFSAFDLTGYLLEPEEGQHLGEQGAVRQALQDEDILQFVSVRDQQELKRVLPKLIKAEGSLKVLVLPVLEQKELEKYRQKIEQKLGQVR
ncbi:hypothetical protein [Pontibacter sp. BAB1700]|uniref:hypothetical protein n=1 Tax=Pontibacter sp. BAB1700 TaxID=1144253 RepID=UPI0012DC3E06|nr:hypothetical protein [Pontibacter sp. BAB1700]